MSICVGRQSVRELRQLGDRHAEVGNPLEMKVRVQRGEDEAKVDRNRCLAREQRLDPLLDGQVESVDLVVERNHLVGELGIALSKRVDRSAKRAEDELDLLAEVRLEGPELLREDVPHPNRPVT